VQQVPSILGNGSSARPPAAEDDALLARVGKGEVAAFEQLYERYSRSIYSLVLGLLGELGAAAEAVQEVFLAIWTQAGRYDPQRGSARSWLLAVAHHKAIDALRRRKVRTTQSLVTEVESGEDPVQQALSRVMGETVREALAEISLPQREVLVLAYYAGLTQQEIANLLDQPLGTVKTRMRDGLLKLRARLGARV
jgi:RNA polymerase sigma-70 factor (ECF subfamily)